MNQKKKETRKSAKKLNRVRTGAKAGGIFNNMLKNATGG